MKSIFISSTFRDMQAERDMVQERVLPALREEARKYGDSVGVIDLRWGVDTSTLETEEGAAKVLKVCLDEIDRSHPYMLIFIGERYGWIPESKLIETAVNGREDKYVTDDYAKSVTALEIEYGALSEKYGELDHCVICFREPVGNILDDAEKGVYIEQTEEGRRKLEFLKEKIKQDLGDEERLITYSCTWDKSARQLADFMSDEQPLENVLVNSFVKMFQDDWKEYKNLSWQEKEQLGFRALMESKLHSFVGREALLEEYYQSAVNGSCPIVLQGEVGSGKTAIMCKLIERLQKEEKNVFFFFSGEGSQSINAKFLVKQMVYYLENLLGLEKHFSTYTERYDDWLSRLQELSFHIGEDEKVYFCIDALDQLFFDEHMAKLDFLIKSNGIQFIVSCTDTFELPSKTMLTMEKKIIPVLSESDAKTVAEGILASYSRNAYAAIENEILKKKSVGNPLYISLLIQRLNMMDMDELRTALTEEEIVALGIRIVREMPEEIEEAIVSIIKAGIDKISKEETTIYEAIQYLAVSRNGLRLWDLKEIFSKQGRQLSVLDFTLFMKYLDSFVHTFEYERIDFTHKVIRQGLLKTLEDREEKEEIIKEYLKTLYKWDSLRMQEGMYFARIRKDEEFAKELIECAYGKKSEELAKTISNDAVEDGGEFCCKLIETETQEDSMVCAFFLYRLKEQLGLAKEEMRAKQAIGEALLRYGVQLYEKNGSEISLWILSHIYNNLSHVYHDLGHERESLLYVEKGLKCDEQLYEKTGDEKSLFNLITSYNNMSYSYRNWGRKIEALTYSEKAVKFAEQLNEKNGSEENLGGLLTAYTNIGHLYHDLGQLKEALMYYEKVTKGRETLYDKNESKSGEALVISYIDMGRVLADLGQRRESVSYYQKALKYAEILYKETGSESCLRHLSVNYYNLSVAYRDLGQLKEALLYAQKAVMCGEQLHEKLRSEKSLVDLLSRYNIIGLVYQDLGKKREVLTYSEKALRCEEQLYEKTGSEKSLNRLANIYFYIGDVYYDLGQLEETLKYYLKGLKCDELLYEKIGSEKRLYNLSNSYSAVSNVLYELNRYEEELIYTAKEIKVNEKLCLLNADDSYLYNLSGTYNNYGWILCEIGRATEAVEYLVKALQYVEELHQKNPTQKSQSALATRWRNLANALLGSGRFLEAIEFGKKATDTDRELYAKDTSDVAEEGLMKSLSIYAEALLTDKQTEEAYKVYTEAIAHCKSVCEKRNSALNGRIYAKVLKGMERCSHESGQNAETE